MTKILVSPGYGAGWSTWADDTYLIDMLTDEKMIAAVERGLTDEDVADFESRMKEKYGENCYIYLGGSRDLEVMEVDGPFLVEEYDGSEYITYGSQLMEL